MSKELPVNTSLSHYRIVSKLGAGGMGEVYRAQDTKLNRTIALKILPADLAANEDRMRRFIQEAQAAAALNHTHIAHIYEIGEAEGIHYIAMEFVDGVTLRDKIHLERIGLAKLLKYLQQAAEGLSKAHASGIVHRDLKPDNIMVTRDGLAKLLDFGLAKLIDQKSPDGDVDQIDDAPTRVMQQQSTPGMVMGTVGYMSPEQAQGKTSEIDHRSDIFSFGCIMFECATGQRPFEGDSIIKSLHKLLYEPAPAIKDLNSAAPPDLQRIVRRCLAKDPDERYQSIREVAIELKELQQEMAAPLDTIISPAAATESVRPSESGATVSESAGYAPHPSQSPPTSSGGSIFAGIKRHRLIIVAVMAALIFGAIRLGLFLRAATTDAALESIAVLPFVNQNHDPETEYRSDGLTESIINSLTQLPGLRVIARSTVFRYKDKETDPMAAGKELGVRAVLTGRIMQRVDDMTISVELVDVRDNKQIWGERYQRKASDLLALQREITKEISANLRLKLSGAEQSRVTKPFTENPEAYQLYLKGRYWWNKRTGEALKKSVEYFNQAIEKDPGYSLAYAGIADAYGLLPGYSAGTPQDCYPKAKAAASRALELDETLAEAHTALANVLIMYDWNLSDSTREFKRAIVLNPNYATAHQWYGIGNLVMTQHFDEAIAEGKRAQELDPFSFAVNQDLANTYIYARQYDKAIEQARKNVELDQNYYVAHWYLGMAYAMKGIFPDAIAEYQKARALDNDTYVLGYLGHAYASSGKREEALKLISQMKEIASQHYVAAYSVATVYAGLGDKDQTFQWLEKSFQDRTVDIAYLKVDPFFDGVRSDPRFDELVRRVGL